MSFDIYVRCPIGSLLFSLHCQSNIFIALNYFLENFTDMDGHWVWLAIS